MGVCIKGKDGSTESTLNELRQLVSTAGAVVSDAVLQRREKADAATFIGKGKIEEIRRAFEETDSDIIIFDNNLSPTWQRNLEKALGCKVVDRTELILDIFAQHAKTRDGKLQVELAQLRYRLPRLPGKGTLMSRLGGGIGTRGPGETQLEIDRRRITERIGKLKRILEKVRSHRISQRKNRKRSSIPTAAIVGYTNAGKSTLLNLLTEADVPAENMLFATLDTTTRRIILPSGQPALLTDTVGFIQNLPEDLLTAFRATLEEVTEADLLLHVVDASSEDCLQQIQTVLEVLDQLEAGNKPILTVFNKADLLTDRHFLTALRADYAPSVEVSALLGVGTQDLLKALAEMLGKEEIFFTINLSYREQPFVGFLHEQARVLEEQFLADGIEIRAQAPRPVFEKIARFTSQKANTTSLRLESPSLEHKTS